MRSHTATLKYLAVSSLYRLLRYYVAMLAFLGTLLGIAVLIAGGTLLVRGASEVAAGFGVSPLLVGLTIVGFGTSSPELVVNILGALSGESGIAFGNVVGSNISNLGLILGISALISPIAIQSQLVRRELPLLLLAITMTTVMAMDGVLEGQPSVIDRTDSVLLLLMFGIFIYLTALDFIRADDDDSLFRDIGGHPTISAQRQGRMAWLMVVGGLVLLLIGGELTIRNGVILAERLGVSTAIVGLFVVAVGTSMPELVTSVIAAIRKQPDLALGNIVGSNIFNSLIVMPASGIITPIAVPDGGVSDLVLSWVFTASILPVFFLGRAELGRAAGAALLLAYAGYAVWRVTGA